MSGIENDQRKRQFDELRRKYPQKLKDIQIKVTILQEWIEKFHMNDCQKISKEQRISSSKQSSSNQKVLDQTDPIKQNDKIDDIKLKKSISEAVKVIVGVIEKNDQVREKYSYQNVQEMIDKVKMTLRQLLKMANNQAVNEKSQKPIKQKQNKVIPQQINPSTKNNEVSNFLSKSTQQKSPQPVQQFRPPPPKQKTNSLFVQKQAPISEKNIFQGTIKEPTIESRPTSRPLGQKIKKAVITQKIKQVQLPQQDTPKQSRVPSPVPQEEKVIENVVEKKNEKLEQSDVEENQPMEVPSLSRVELKSSKIEIEQKQEVSSPLYQNQPEDEIQNQEQIVEQQQNQQFQHPIIGPSAKKIVFDSKTSQFHLPSFQLSTERPTIPKKNPIQSILTNPYIKKTFNHLCKQSYLAGGKTFDQIAQSADIMNLNKWMVFCKEFDFLQKLKKNRLVDIFFQSTQNKPQMIQKQFLDALIIVQDKLRVDEEDFIRKYMCLDSEFAFRQKAASLKVNYGGPKRNFFQQATIKPLDKYYQNLREEAFQKERSKQKEIILFQGKFRQEIQSQLRDRKNKREVKKSNIERNGNHNRSVILTSIQRKSQQSRGIKHPYLNYVEKKTNVSGNSSVLINKNDLGLSKLHMSKKVDPLSYADLFSQKSSNATRAVTTQKKITDLNPVSAQKQLKKISNQTNYINNPRAATQLSKTKPQTSQNIPKISQKNPTQATQIKHGKAQDTKPQRQWTQIKNWAQDLGKYESDESDEILREHLGSQKLKKTHLPQRMQLSRMMEDFKRDPKQLQQNDNIDEHSQWERETQFQTTSKRDRLK